MLLTPEFNQLILSIYQGILEEDPWSDFAHQLHSFFNADIVVLSVISTAIQDEKCLLKRVITNDPYDKDYTNHWIALDPFQSIDAEQPTLLNELHPKQAIEHTPYFQDLVKPTGVRYILAMNITVPSHPNLTFKIRIARNENRDNFSHTKKEQLASLIEHLKLALRFLDQIAIQQIERNAFADAMNQFMLGTLILDRAGKIVASNRVARDTITQYTQLNIIEGALVIKDNKINHKLYSALANIESGSIDDNPLPKTLSIGLNNSTALGLMIRPVRPEDAVAYPVHAHAVVFLSDPQGKQEISSATLRELFGFTEGESKVAAYLSNGYTLNEAAEKLSISVNTAKSHARCIYEKTGVNKQTKLIQLIANSVARVS